jgi:hypothetical protein
MKNVAIAVISFFLFCIPSIGQIRVIDETGRTYIAFGGIANIAEEIFLFRDIYGQYPKDKKILLDFILNKERYNSIDDFSYLNQIRIKRKALTRLLKNRKNRLTVSCDTCFFYIAKTGTTIQCIGGVANLQSSDSYLFRHWTFSRFYDKDGNYLQALGSESPFMPQDINKRFDKVVTTEPKSLDEHDIVVHKWSTPPVLIPIIMTRSGLFSYDVSCLNGLQLFYQEFGKPFNPDNTIGPISIEEAIDVEYLDAMKSYLNDFMEKHEEVDSLKLWELVLFNKPSD